MHFLKPHLEDLEQIYLINLQNKINAWSKEAVKAEIDGFYETSRVHKDKGGKIIGFIFIRPTGDYHEITSIGVDITARRQGWGRGLLEHAAEQAKISKNIKGLRLEVSEQNTAALTLYLNFGFTQTRKRLSYYTDGSNAIEMTWDIT